MSFIYLDNNATTQVDPKVLEVMVQELKEAPSNPSSMHALGKAAKKRLSQARDLIAHHLEVSPDTLFFTSSGTEAISLMLQGFLKGKKGHIISSDIEHASMYNTLKALEKEGFLVTFLSPGLKGHIDPQELENAIRPDTLLIALSAVNSETGVKNNLFTLAEVASSHNIALAIDGVGLLGKEAFKIPEGLSAMAFSGHKLHGPKGVGLLFKRAPFKIEPLFLGGGQEKGLRSGTENLPGALGLSKAIDLFYTQSEAITAQLKTLQDRLEQGLKRSCSPLTIHGQGPKIPGTLNLSFDGVDGETLLTLLDMEGVAVSQGSACSSGGLEPSRILLNMGVDPHIAKGAIRLSLSRFNTEEELDEAVQKIAAIVHKIREFTINQLGFKLV